MHTQVQSVPLDARRTAWTRAGLRIGLRGDQRDHYQPLGRSPRRGVLDVLVGGLPVRVGDDDPLPPPLLHDGHLVNPIARTSDGRLALDVDEADRPITRHWRPRPEDLRCEPWSGGGTRRAARGGMRIALDLELAGADPRPADDSGASEGGVGCGGSVGGGASEGGGAHGAGSTTGGDPLGAGDHPGGGDHPAGSAPAADRSLGVELILKRSGESLALPAELVPGPGTVGLLRAGLPDDALRPGEHWTLLLRTAHRTSRLGLDLTVSAAGLPTARPSVAVTVVIPVADEPAQQVADCIGTALSQTLPAAHYEILAVDRGSGTGTSGLLDWLATLHRRLRVLRPGGREAPADATDAADATAAPAELAVRRGIADARGQFVCFLRPVDRLAPHALRDLLGYAWTHAADVVLGRSADARRTGSPPRPPFRRSLPYATVVGDDLVRELTPDQLFRTSLLHRHGLSFGPPGPDRQRFVAEAYLAADRVAVFAGRVCRYRGPDDPAPTPPAEHAAQLTGALTALERHEPVGSGTHTRFLRHWYRTEILGRLRGDALLALPPRERPTRVRESAELAAKHADPTLARGLPPAEQLVAALLARHEDGAAGHDPHRREADPTLRALLALAEWERTLTAEAEVRWLRPGRNGLAISAGVRLCGHGAPAFRSDGGGGSDRVFLDPPLAATRPCAVPDAPSAATGTVPDPRSVRRHLDAARVEVVATADAAGEAGRPESVVTAHTRSVRFEETEFRVRADLPTDAVPGRRLRLEVRLRCCGWTRTAPLVAGAGVLARQRPVHPPLPHTGAGPVAVDIPEHGGRPMATLTARPPRAPVTAHLRAMLRALGQE